MTKFSKTCSLENLHIMCSGIRYEQKRQRVLAERQAYQEEKQRRITEEYKKRREKEQEMGKVITTTLADLPATFAKTMNEMTNPITNIPKSTDPLVDGSAMTTNEDIKHRRKRIIGDPKHRTKKAKIQEFQALCNWLIGKGEPLEKPTIQHKNVLAAVRNKTKIPESYRCFIINNYDLVLRASYAKPKSIDKKWETYEFNKVRQNKKEEQTMTQTKEQEKPSMQDCIKLDKMTKLKKNSVHVKRYAYRIDQWLTKGGQVTQMVCSAVKYYQLHGSKGYSNTYPSSLLIAMQFNRSSVMRLYCDTRKSFIRPMTEEELKLDITEVYNSKSQNKTNSIIEQPKEPEVKQEQNISTVPDTLSMLIQLAKKAGATELIIKL